MPDFPIIDTHVHLWAPTHFRIPWLDGDETLNKPFGLREYHEHTQGIDIEAMVYVEVNVVPAYSLLEAQWAYERTREDSRLQGLVVSAPLEYGEHTRAFLQALRAIGPRVKGVRRLLQGEPDPNFALSKEFVRGVQMLPEYGFSFDICISHHQLDSIIKLVRQCPDTTFILDHIAKPDIQGQVLDPWREQIQALAAFPNVACKVSGMVTEADPLHWTPDDLAPYVSHVLASFGEDRVMFGGDWPVVLHASSYEHWYETLDQLTVHLSEEAKHKLWAENARRIYRLTTAE
jgi:L-fuconolactonase